MELSFEELREKEVINILNGKKLGHITDIIFDTRKAFVRGVLVPGDKKIFKKSEDIFISINEICRVGDDVILVRLNENNSYKNRSNIVNGFASEKNLLNIQNNNVYSAKYKKNDSYIRYRKVRNNKLN